MSTAGAPSPEARSPLPIERCRIRDRPAVGGIGGLVLLEDGEVTGQFADVAAHRLGGVGQAADVVLDAAVVVLYRAGVVDHSAGVVALLVAARLLGGGLFRSHGAKVLLLGL